MLGSTGTNYTSLSRFLPRITYLALDAIQSRVVASTIIEFDAHRPSDSFEFINKFSLRISNSRRCISRDSIRMIESRASRAARNKSDTVILNSSATIAVLLILIRRSSYFSRVRRSTRGISLPIEIRRRCFRTRSRRGSRRIYVYSQKAFRCY